MPSDFLLVYAYHYFISLSTAVIITALPACCQRGMKASLLLYQTLLCTACLYLYVPGTWLERRRICPRLLHEGVWRSKGIAPFILKLGTRWWRLASITLRPFYVRGKNCLYLLSRSFGGLQNLKEY